MIMRRFTLKQGITSNQAAFDAACRHLARQGHRAMSPGEVWDAIVSNTCAYYTSDGDRCAIGALVTVETAKMLEENYSGLGVDELPLNYGGVSEDFLNDLQQAHDAASGDKHTLLGALLGVAEVYELDPSAADLITEWAG